MLLGVAHLKGQHAYIVAAVLAAMCIMAIAPHGDGEANKTTRPAIYNINADGQKQIAEALAKAKPEHKQILLQFGANWCGWCHKLHRLFESDPKIAAKLKENYIVVLVDVDKNHNAEVVKQYGNPTKLGLPVIVVLDSEGKQLTTQDTGKLEEGDHHSPEKVLEFLNQWSATKK